MDNEKYDTTKFRWAVWSNHGKLLFVGTRAEANAYAKTKGVSPLNVCLASTDVSPTGRLPPVLLPLGWLCWLALGVALGAWLF